MSKEEKTLTKDQVIEQITQDSRARGFIEYPKMLHKTDGSNIIVNTKEEEEKALRSADVHPTPDDALAEKDKRDEAEAEKLRLKIGKDAADAGKNQKR